jgi:hypothetical protein
MTNRKVYQDLENINKEAVIAEGFDDAYIGYARRAKTPSIALYDYEACIEILMDDQEWGRREAVRFMENSVCESWFGDATPAFVFLRVEKDDKEEY